VNEWNNKAHNITGYSKEDILGKNFVEVYITKEFRASVKQVSAIQGYLAHKKLPPPRTLQ